MNENDALSLFHNKVEECINDSVAMIDQNTSGYATHLKEVLLKQSKELELKVAKLQREILVIRALTTASVILSAVSVLLTLFGR